MGRMAYVNGRFVPHGEATVHIEDRGYQLADAVYEVWGVFDGRLGDPEGHFARLARSLDELSIPMPMSRASLTLVLKEAVRRWLAFSESEPKGLDDDGSQASDDEVSPAPGGRRGG